MDNRGIKRTALFISAFSSFFVPFMISSIQIALPSIEKDLPADAVMLSWVSTSFLLSTAVALVPIGRVGDLYGRKRVFSWGMIVFALFSFLPAFSTSIRMLICFRIFQGFGSAMIFSSRMAILTSIFPPGERGSAFGINMAAVYAGLLCGPFIGGILSQHLSWRSIFLTTTPLCIVVIILIFKKLKGEWAEAKGESFDFKGTVIYTMTMVMLTYGISRLPSPLSIVLVILGGAGLIAFVKWELSIEHPVFEVRLFRSNRIFSFSCLAALIHYSAAFGVTFMLSLFLQYIKQLTPQVAGTVLMAQPIMMALFSPLIGRMSDRIEPRVLASTGFILMAVGLLLMLGLGRQTAVSFIVWCLVLHGLGYALFSSPNMNAIMSSVEKRYYGIASGSIATTRLLGQMFSMGITTMILALYVGRVQITPEYHPVFIKSVNTTFIVFAILCVVGIFLSLSRGKLRTE